MPLPRIAISLGDPFGIGPEVVVAALADPSLRGSAQWVIHGSSQPMLEAAEKRNIEPWWHRVDCDGERQEHGFSHPAVLIDEPLPSSGPSQPGPSDIGGHFSKQWVERAVADTLRPSDHARHADAMVTAPIANSSWRMAGSQGPGPTALLPQPAAVRQPSPSSTWTPGFHVRKPLRVSGRRALPAAGHHLFVRTARIKTACFSGRVRGLSGFGC